MTRVVSPTTDFWQGKCVRLRAVEPADAPTFFQWNQNSERSRALDFVWPPSSLASVTAWVEEHSRNKLKKDTFHFVIEDLEGAPVGSISTHHCEPRNGTFSYGVDIAPEHQRRGYASESIRLVLKYYFQELRYQKASVAIHSYNEASIRLHQRLGFKREGTLRRMVFTRGQYYDLIWFGITAEESAA
jgi:RimJ/RimL family protein N-acetyltransferase